MPYYETHLCVQQLCKKVLFRVPPAWCVLVFYAEEHFWPHSKMLLLVTSLLKGLLPHCPSRRHLSFCVLGSVFLLVIELRKITRVILCTLRERKPQKVLTAFKQCLTLSLLLNVLSNMSFCFHGFIHTFVERNFQNSNIKIFTIIF